MKGWTKAISKSSNTSLRQPTKNDKLQTNNSALSSIDISSICIDQYPISYSVQVQLQQYVQGIVSNMSMLAKLHKIEKKQVLKFISSSLLYKQISTVDVELIDQLIGQSVRNKIQLLQHKLQLKSQQLESLKQQLRLEKQFDQSHIRQQTIQLSDINSVVYQLYQKAQEKDFQDFQKFYQKLQHSSPKQLSKVIRFPAKNTINYFPLNTNKMNQPEKRLLLSQLKKQLTCSRPCCRWQTDNTRPLQAKLNSSHSISGKNKQSVYKTATFDRYKKKYIGQQFKLANVISVTRTKTEMLDKQYDKFIKRQRIKRQQHSRNQSIA